MDRYVLIDNEGYRVNTVLWDGSNAWDIPDGYTVQLESECSAMERPPLVDPE